MSVIRRPDRPPLKGGATTFQQGSCQMQQSNKARKQPWLGITQTCDSVAFWFASCSTSTDKASTCKQDAMYTHHASWPSHFRGFNLSCAERRV